MAIANSPTSQGVQEPQERPKAQPELEASSFMMLSLASPGELLLLALGVLGAVLHGTAQPVTTIFFGTLIDLLGDPTTGPDEMLRGVAYVAGLLAIAGVVVVFCAQLQYTCFKIFAERMVKRMRVAYLDSVLRKDIAWYDVREVSQLPNQITSDIDTVAEAFGDKLAASIMSVSCFLAGYATAFVVGWMLALALLSVLVAIFVGLALTGRAVKAVKTQSQSWYGQAASVVEECLFAMRTVVAFGGEQRELEKYSVAVTHARRMGVRNAGKAGIGLAWISAVLFAGYALAFYFGGTLRYDDVVNPATGKVWQPGNIMTTFFCVLVGAVNLNTVAPGINAWKAGRASAGRFFDALRTPSAIEGKKGDTRKALARLEELELRKVHFSYPAKPEMKVLNGLSLSIKRGQRVAVVGESGSGKSTVMSLLERFYDPQEGQVLVNGEDIKNFSISSVRRCIGYVGQEPVLFATSIRENILQGCQNATEEDVERACRDAQLTFVENLPEKLDTFVGSGGSQFSGGQKQRIAIARALVKKAAFLFLDEATSALDNASEKMIQATIEHISKNSEGGLGIVSIAHRLSTVQNCDVIFVLSRGVVAESGTHASLLEAKSLYHALASAQQLATGGQEEASAAGEHGTQSSRAGEGAGEAASPSAAAEQGEASPGPRCKSGLAGQAAQEEDRQKDVLKAYKVPLRRLLNYCKPEWPWFVPAFFGSMVEGASMPVVSLILVQAMVAFWYPKDMMMDKVQEVCIAFICMAGITLLFVSLQHLAFAVISEAMTQRLRVAILSALFRQEIGFHDDPENTPGMQSRALELYAFRVTTFNRTFGVEIGALSCVATGLGIGFAYCWQMTLVMLCSIPVLALAYRLQMVVADGNVKKENQTLKTSQQIIVDSVMNARTVHACGSEQDLVHLYDTMVSTALQGLYLRSILAGIAFGVASGTRFFILAGGFYYGATLINGGNANFEGVMAAFMGILFAGIGAGRCMAMLGDANKAKLAAHDMFKILDRESRINGLEPTGVIPSAAKADAGLIEFENVQFFYPFRSEIQVLKGVSFRITPGMSVGLVGPSGGGKSTVMAMLQRFYDPTGGSVYVGSARTPLASLNIRWWRRQIGFVGQEPILFNTTVRQNVLYGLDDGETISEERLEECKRMANLKFLDEANSRGWETEVGPRGSRLSGGQKQRVAICRALVRDPPLLLLDEATSALDSQSERVVQEALEAAGRGRTTFAIAHRLSTIANSDVIVVVAEGVVIERGTHAELMSLQGVYYRLQMQSQQ